MSKYSLCIKTKLTYNDEYELAKCETSLRGENKKK